MPDASGHHTGYHYRSRSVTDRQCFYEDSHNLQSERNDTTITRRERYNNTLIQVEGLDGVAGGVGEEGGDLGRRAERWQGRHGGKKRRAVLCLFSSEEETKEPWPPPLLREVRMDLDPGGE